MRTYKECARRFVTILIDEFRTFYTHHELGCTLQRVEMEKCQRSHEDIKTYGALTVEQMERRARLRGLLALVSTTNDGKKRMEFVNCDFNAAINIRKCAVMETRPPELTWENFVGQPLKVELYEKKLESVVCGRSKKTARRLHVTKRRLVYGGFLATTLHLCPQRLSFERRLLSVMAVLSTRIPRVKARRQLCQVDVRFPKDQDAATWTSIQRLLV